LVEILKFLLDLSMVNDIISKDFSVGGWDGWL